MSTQTLSRSSLSLPLLRRGKVRDVYEADPEHLLLVASDRVSAFDVIMHEAIPHKGAVLTQLSAWWFRQLSTVTPSHFVTADHRAIIERVPALAPHAEQLRGRTMLVRRTRPVPFECVVRGYIAGSAWAEYRESGTLAGEPLPPGLVECAALPEPIFSPATKAEAGHDENITFGYMTRALGDDLATRLRSLSLAVYAAGRDTAITHDIIIADTKFEFGTLPDGTVLLIDEVLTPDSSRFWPADRYHPGRGQPSFDKQPLRDWLANEKGHGRWNGEAPAPPLPDEVVAAMSARYLDIFHRLTGAPLGESA